MFEYNINWLKGKGFFKQPLSFKIENKEVIFDEENKLAYVEVSNNDELEKIRKKIIEEYGKIKYIWFYFPNEKRLKVHRRIVGELYWFWYNPNIRKEYRESKEDKLKRLSPGNIDILFDVRDVAESFYWKLWEIRIRMAKSIRDLKNDWNKLMVVQRFIDRMIFLYFLSQLGLVEIKTKDISWRLDRERTREFFKWVCDKFSNSEKNLQDFFNRIFFDILGKFKEDGWSSERFEIGGEEFFIEAPSLDGELFKEEFFENKSEREIRFSGIRELILNILNKYNWIIGEEMPEEEDVIGELTPDIIGHIYEKFVVSLEQFGKELKEIKLDDLKAVKGELRLGRKKIGAYYTPDKITNYISMNTIYPYIVDRINKKFNTKYKNIQKDLLRKNEFTKEELEQIKFLYFEVLRKMKICDNACGSGSFLLAAGKILLRLYSRVIKILEKHLSEDSDVKNLLNEIKKSPSRNYYIVREIIVNNLYGVDIMEGAIEIAKLRLWLWLISQVDPNKIRGKRIETLPNLDFNLMVGNSLIGYIDIENIEFDFVGKQKTLYHWLKRGHEKIEWLKELARKKQKFKTLPIQEAVRLKEEFKKELDKAREILNEKFYNLLKSKGVEISYEEFLKLKPFHWGFEFYEVFDLEKPKEERGFDIIIGNPPYLRQEKIKEEKKYYSVLYETFDGKADLYVYFDERSLKTLKTSGYFGYIQSNKWMRAAYGKNLRRFLLSKEIKEIIDFAGVRVFSDPTVDVCIIIIKNDPTTENNKVKFLKARSVEQLEEEKKKFGIKVLQKNLKEEAFIFLDERLLKLKEKIEKIGKPLKYWDVKIYFGIKTGFNEAFIIDTKTRNKILANCKTEEERKRIEKLIRPVLRGRDIGRYCYEWKGTWMIVIPAGWTNQNRGMQDPEDYFKKTLPSIYNHLISFSDYEGKGKGLFNRDDQGDYWWELRHCDYYDEFEKEKVVWQRVTQRFSFCYVPGEFYVLDSASFLTGSNIKFLLGILNSKLIDWYIKTYVHQLADTGFLLSKQYVEKVVIPPITPQNQHIVKEIENLVDRIIQIKKQKGCSADTSELEKQIDQLVYKLYNLTPEEIELIENFEKNNQKVIGQKDETKSKFSI